MTEMSGEPLDDWVRLFNAQTQEELEEFEGKNQGLREAVEMVKLASMARDCESLRAFEDGMENAMQR